MAEPVYKKITELDTLSASLDGNETLPIVKSGKTYRRTWANFFGSGWITSLLGAFSAFKAPDANHADDSDTVEGESTAQLHAAGSLTGALNLAVIPAELTGKNAATASSAAKLTTARTIGGVYFDGSANINLPGVNTKGNQDTTGTSEIARSVVAFIHGATIQAGYYLKIIRSTGSISYVYYSGSYTIPDNELYIELFI